MYIFLSRIGVFAFFVRICDAAFDIEYLGLKPVLLYNTNRTFVKPTFQGRNFHSNTQGSR